MAEGFSDYKFRGVSQTPQIAIPTIGEEKVEAGPQLSFAERVGALDEHDRKKIDRYLSGKDPKILSPSKQRRILSDAILDEDVDAVKVLLECGVDVNRYDSEGVTPLIQACEFPHPGIVKALLLKGADPNITSEDGLQLAPLHIAAAHTRSVEKKQNALACAELLLNHGADVNQRIFATEKTPLHFVGPHTQPQLLALLLSRGADPLAEAYDGEQPRLGPAHFRGLGTHLTAALENGNSRQVDRWITVVEGFLPDPEAASLLVEWAPLCIHDGKLANRIHTGIERFLKMTDGDPPVEVLRYVACHNARETREEVLSKLKVAELTPVGMRDEFGIIGNYSPAKHGLLLIELARSWAQDPTEDHMVHVMAILKFVASSAADAPWSVRADLHDEIVKLQSELFNDAVPELVERASSVRDFLGQGPFALDKLE